MDYNPESIAIQQKHHLPLKTIIAVASSLLLFCSISFQIGVHFKTDLRNIDQKTKLTYGEFHTAFLTLPEIHVIECYNLLMIYH